MLRKRINFKLGGSSGDSLLARRATARWLAPGISIGMLAILGIVALNPVASPLTYAEESTVVAYLSPSITLSMNPSVSEMVEPTVDGSFKNLSTVARVQVMNSDYYDISISGNPDMVGQNNPDEKIAAISGEKKANEFSANTWGYNVSKNGTGVTSAEVATETTTYSPISSTATAVAERQQTKNNAADDYYSLNFGAKVDTSIPADTYTSQVVLSVVATPSVVVAGLGGVTTMQDLTPEVCRNIGTTSADDQYKYTDPFGKTYWTAQMRDARDGKMYWVAKLADGNCWMTQNLALDIPDEGLTSELTALKSGVDRWVPPEGTRVAADMTGTAKDNRFKIAKCPSVAEGGAYGSGKEYQSESECLGANSGHSWDEGDYVLIFPGRGEGPLEVSIDAIKGGMEGWANKQTVLSVAPSATSPVLTDYGVVVEINSSWIVATDQEFTKSDSYKNAAGQVVNKMAGWAVDPVNKVYDAHYLVGNFYQWLAATTQSAAEGGSVATGRKISGSVCPSNWELPTSGSYYDDNGTVISGSNINYVGRGSYLGYNDTSGSFFNLASKYVGISTLGSSSGIGGSVLLTSKAQGSNLTLEDFVSGAPLYAVRAGLIYTDSRDVYSVGWGGRYWSSVPYSTTEALNMYFSDTVFTPSRSYNWYTAYSVRCLVNVAE